MSKVPTSLVFILMLCYCAKNEGLDSDREEKSPSSSLVYEDSTATNSVVSTSSSTDVTGPHGTSFSSGPLPVFVLIGGSSSCDNSIKHPMGGSTLNVEMREPFFEMLEALAGRSGQIPDFIVSCYLRNLERPFGLGTIRVATMQSGVVEQIMNEAELSAFVSRYAGGREVSLIGHSYGGWLAMNIARDFIFNQHQPVSFLTTIDPISAVTCKKVTDIGCRMAPTDFNVEQKNDIRNLSKGWLHFYQRITPVLRSCEIPEATEQHHILRSHFNIDISHSVWRTIFVRTSEVFLGR